MPNLAQLHRPWKPAKIILDRITQEYAYENIDRPLGRLKAVHNVQGNELSSL